MIIESQIVNKRYLRYFQVCTFKSAHAELTSRKWKKENGYLSFLSRNFCSTRS